MARVASPIRDDHNQTLDTACLETRSLRAFVMVLHHSVRMLAYHSVRMLAYLHMLMCVCVCLCALSHMTPQIHIPGRKYVELRLQMIEWRQMIDETFVYGLRR